MMFEDIKNIAAAEEMMMLNVGDRMRPRRKQSSGYNPNVAHQYMQNGVNSMAGAAGVLNQHSQTSATSANNMGNNNGGMGSNQFDQMLIYQSLMPFGMNTNGSVFDTSQKTVNRR